MKLSCMKPCFTDPSQDLYCFDVCNAEGDNQFIPHFDSTYYVRVEIYSGDGKPVYSGKSGWKDFLFLEEPIYDEFNTVPTYSSVENWLEVDRKRKTPVSRISVGFRQQAAEAIAGRHTGPTIPCCPFVCGRLSAGSTAARRARAPSL